MNHLFVIVLRLEEHLGPRLSHFDYVRAVISEEDTDGTLKVMELCPRTSEGLCFHVTSELKALIKGKYYGQTDIFVVK